MNNNSQRIDFDRIHNLYYEKYKKIFAGFEFCTDRFTEENQTVNFCHAIEEVYTDAVVWYEYPWKKESAEDNQRGSSCRYDAVVYLPDQKALLIVESKCLRGSNSKYIAIRDDLKRIIRQQNKQIKIKNGHIESIYAVILADYWKKGGKAKFYTNIDAVWQNTSESILGEKEGKPFSEFLDLTKKLGDPQWRFCDSLEGYKNYCLLSMIGTVDITSSQG